MSDTDFDIFLISYQACFQYLGLLLDDKFRFLKRVENQIKNTSNKTETLLYQNCE